MHSFSQVPTDCEIVHGRSQVSMQHISGESLPMEMSQGVEIPGGSVNHDGVLVLRATAAPDASTPARIAALAEEALVRWGAFCWLVLCWLSVEMRQCEHVLCCWLVGRGSVATFCVG